MRHSNAMLRAALIAACNLVVPLGPHRAAAEVSVGGARETYAPATAFDDDGLAILGAEAAGSSVKRLDLGASGFACGMTDGTWGYVVPMSGGEVVRFDLATFSQMQTLKLQARKKDADLSAFSGGGCFLGDGYGYLLTSVQGSGKVVRFATDTFKKVEVMDLTEWDDDIKSFAGGFTDGKYGYVIPFFDDDADATFGKIARFELAFFNDDDMEIETLDLTASDDSLRGFIGGFHDSMYGYLVPFDSGTPGNADKYSGKAVRFTLANFSDVEVLDLPDATGDAYLVGFYRGFQDGTHGYLVPGFNGKTHGKFTRFDLATFKKVEVLDLTQKAKDLRGFVCGFESKGYGYLIPHQDGHGQIMRPFGKVAVVDLVSFNVSDVTVLDLANMTGDSKMVDFYDGFTHEGYGYAVPHEFHEVARFTLKERHPGWTPTPSPSPSSDDGSGGGRSGGGVLLVVLLVSACLVAGGLVCYFGSSWLRQRGFGPRQAGAGAGGGEVELR